MDLALATALVIALALNVYAISGGADYGGGVWDLLARGPRAARQRDLIAHSIGPIWEANHVWLILAIVALFTGFPAAYARVTTILHVPLLLMLLGIVARGAAFSFRSYGRPEGEDQGHWGRVFAISSLVTPLLLGIILGAIASGEMEAVPRSVAAFFDPWVGLFPFAVGVYALVMFAFLAAVYLCNEAEEADLAEDFRRRALASGVLLGVLAAAVLLAAGLRVPDLLHELTRTPWSWALHAATALAALFTFRALWSRRYRLARAGAALQVSLILWGWALAQYPYLVKPDLTVGSAAAPDVTLRLLLGALAVGAVVLVPSFLYLYRVFGKLRRA
ncbi:MAG TPA: cytochrome d ubiquinol oxidase subunit II [Thermoanaerobaculia bacterium]|nr:cytochrome d ubiquinol oxidase subunit II [Thermoanaerobaculia bacterium]